MVGEQFWQRLRHEVDWTKIHRVSGQSLLIGVASGFVVYWQIQGRHIIASLLSIVALYMVVVAVMGLFEALYPPKDIRGDYRTGNGLNEPGL